MNEQGNASHPKPSLARFLAGVTANTTEYNKIENAETVGRFVSYLIETRGRSANTVKGYRSLLGMWLDEIGVDPILSPATATRERMQAFVQRKRTTGTVGSAASRKRDVDVLRSFYRWAHEEGLTETFLAINLHGPTVRNVNPRPVPDDIWLKLWTAPLKPTDRVMLGLGYYLGLRRAELAELRPQQVTLERLVDFTRKGGGEHVLDWKSILAIYTQRLPHLAPAKQMEAFTSNLVALSYSDREFLLPHKGSGESVGGRLETIQRKHDVPRFTAHVLRHSMVNNLLRAGVPIHLVKEIANHTSINTTMRYVRAGGAELRTWMNETGLGEQR